jgi:hypothetical protein
MIARNLLSSALLVTGALALGACSGSGTVETGVAVAPTAPPSTLVVQWSLDEGADPNQCVATGSAAIEITVTDPNGQEVGTFQQDCQAFSTSITLPAGSYTANAILLDGGNQPRTTSVDIAPFVLNGNDQLTVNVDFPASSFLR